MTAAPAVEPQSFATQPFNLVGLVGLAFTVVGGAEIATQIFPLSLGNAEWEFGTYSAVMDSMPPLMIGLGFLGAFAVVKGIKPLAVFLGVAAFLLAVLLVGFAFLYATNVPQALRVNPNSPIETGIKKAVTKASFQTAIFPAALIWFGAYVIRNSSKHRR